MKKLAVLLAMAWVAGSGYAVTANWAGGTGDWATAGNWSTGSVPGSGDDARVDTGTANIITDIGTVAQLRLNGSGTTPVVNIGNNATFGKLFVSWDPSRSGTIYQTAGTVDVDGADNEMIIGRYGTGTYTLSGGSMTHSSSTRDTYVGLGGTAGPATGSFNQTGGTFTKAGTVQKNIYVGHFYGAEGTLNLSGGSFVHAVGDELALGRDYGASGYLNISGTASLRVGDGTGVPASGEPANGFGDLRVGKAGYGKVVQTGGSVEANYIKMGQSGLGYGDYVISGGTLDLHGYLFAQDGSSTFTVSGSAAGHIRMQKFIPNTRRIGIELDADGSTLIEANGEAADRYHDGNADARWQIDTLSDFDGVVGDKYDVLFAETGISNSPVGIYNYGAAIFDWEVAATNGGEMFRLVMTGTKTNAVVWSGTGDWMDSNHWADVSPAPDWTIPGSTSGNAGEALLRSGSEVNITASSCPDYPVARMDIGGALGATLNITGGSPEFRDFWMAEAGQSATINQTGGDVVVSATDSTHIGRIGQGTYNLSGGTLTHTNSGDGTHTLIGVYGGSVGTFNQSGGTFRKNGVQQQNIIVGAQAESRGVVNLSGGSFLFEVGSDFRVGESAGSRGYLNLSGTAEFQIGDGTGGTTYGWAKLIVGDAGYGRVEQTGGSVDANYLILADETSGEGRYTISGGSLDIHRYAFLERSTATMTVAGSGIDHVRVNKFILNPGATLNLQLDTGGITPIEVIGTTAGNEDAILKGTVAVDTLDGFSAPAGTVFDVLVSSNDILNTATDMTFTNLSDAAEFSWAVVTDGSVKKLQLTMTAGPSAFDAWAADSGLDNGDAGTFADPDGDGLDNLHEYAFGGDPSNSADSGYPRSYALGAGGGSNWVDYVFPQLTDTNSGISYRFEITDDLVYGVWANAGDVLAGTGTFGAGYDAITNRISTDSKDEQFMRLLIDTPLMDVACWNILGYDDPGIGVTNWAVRKSGVAQAMVDSGAPVIGVQEIRYRDIADYLHAELAEDGYAAVPASTAGFEVRFVPDVVLPDGLQGRHWQQVIYYKSSVFDELDSGQTVLYEGDGTSTYSPLGFFRERSFTWVKLRHRGTGQTHVVINTHLEPSMQANRINATIHLKNVVETFPTELPIVLMGDFNAQSDSTEMQHLTADGTLTNVVEFATQVDYILQRNFEDRHRDLAESQIDPVIGLLSDHSLLAARLKLDEE